MSIKDILKKNLFLKKTYLFYLKKKYEIATMISPKLNTSMRYRAVFGKKLDLKNPVDFSDKILWLKLNTYYNNPLVRQCADKYKVREYVERAGCAYILNELLCVYESVEEIKWDELPDKFAIKLNVGCGYNIIVSDKQKLNIEEAERKLAKWIKEKYYLAFSEMQYKDVKPYILVEKYLETEIGNAIPDYKVYCFNGVPKAILVMHDRNRNIKSEFFDSEWNALDNTDKYAKPDITTQRPECLEEMMTVSKKLSAPFPFVRCDFYIVENRLVFGEMTFTPAGGLMVSQTCVDGKSMGELLDITSLFQSKKTNM